MSQEESSDPTGHPNLRIVPGLVDVQSDDPSTSDVVQLPRNLSEMEESDLRIKNKASIIASHRAATLGRPLAAEEMTRLEMDVFNQERVDANKNVPKPSSTYHRLFDRIVNRLFHIDS